MVEERPYIAPKLADKLTTYHRFLLGARYVVLAFAVILSFLILTFCGAGFGAGLFVAVVELGVGLYFAKDRKKLSWASEAATLVMSTSAEHPHPVEDEAVEATLAQEAKHAA
jgi:hypothetical protein